MLSIEESGLGSKKFGGEYKIYLYEKTPIGENMIRCVDLGHNGIPDEGAYDILEYIGGVTGAVTTNFSKVGAGNSDTAFANGQTDLIGTNLFKTRSSISRVGRALYIYGNFSYNEAIFTWKEIGLKSATDILLSRIVIPVADQFAKTSSIRVVVEVRVSL